MSVLFLIHFPKVQFFLKVSPNISCSNRIADWTDISEYINVWAVDYPSSSITVNYKDKQSHTVLKSADTSMKRRRMGV